jgi:hypothetical protein
MDKAKRARTAETPKQPSLGLQLRAPYLYPDLRALVMGTAEPKTTASPLGGVERKPWNHRSRLIRRVGRDGVRGRGGNGTWPRARSEQRRQRTTSEAKESPWRPTKIVAAPRKVRNQFVGDVDFDGRLLGTGPELPHGFPGLISQPAVDAALKAIEPPEFDLRLPYLFGRIGRRADRGRLAWLDGPTPL